MKLRKADTGPERQILIGMVVSDDFLRQVIPIHRDELLRSSYAQVVSRWCLDYYSRYSKAPKQTLQDVYEVEKTKLPEEVSLAIGNLLAGLSDEYERDKFNAAYALDQAEEYYRGRSLDMLASEIKTSRAAGDDSTKTEQLLMEYKRIQKPGGRAIDPFSPKAIKSAFEEQLNPLFQFKGALGQLVGPGYREDFWAYLAPEKRGKTWWLLETAYTALRQNCNVAFIAVGDMSTNQVIKRLHSRISGANVRRDLDILQPILDCKFNQEDSCDREERPDQEGVIDDGKQVPWSEAKEHKTCIACRSTNRFRGAIWYRPYQANQLDWKTATKKAKRIKKKISRSMRVFSYPNRAIGVTGIKAELDVLQDIEDWVPDVVVIDYADNLLAESKDAFRHTQNEIWQDMRGMAQERHCLVVTATQADAAGYDKAVLGMKNFSEDKRKLSHVTQMMGLNQSPDEKKSGLMRLNMIILREEDNDPRRIVNIIQCLDMGRPAMSSFF